MPNGSPKYCTSTPFGIGSAPRGDAIRFGAPQQPAVEERGVRDVEGVLDRRLHRGADVVGQDDLAASGAHIGEPRTARSTAPGRARTRTTPRRPARVRRGRRRPAVRDVAVEAGDGDARAATVEAPAVVAALERARVDAAHGQRRVSVRASVGQHAGPAGAVAEHDKRRVHELDGQRLAGAERTAHTCRIPRRSWHRDRVGPVPLPSVTSGIVGVERRIGSDPELPWIAAGRRRLTLSGARDRRGERFASSQDRSVDNVSGCNSQSGQSTRSQERAADPEKARRGVRGAVMADAVMQVVRRCTFGFSPTLYREVEQVGANAWLNAQLEPETIGDGRSRRRSPRSSPAS